VDFSDRPEQEPNPSKRRVYRLYREKRGQEEYVGVELIRRVFCGLWIQRRRLGGLANRVLRDFRHL
jgi:hypothetical protein